jgi:hypothetical protein
VENEVFEICEKCVCQEEEERNMKARYLCAGEGRRHHVFPFVGETTAFLQNL